MSDTELAQPLTISRLFGLVVLCLLSPWAWLVSIALLMIGASISSMLDLDLPTSSMWLSLIGAPLGAMMEEFFEDG